MSMKGITPAEITDWHMYHMLLSLSENTFKHLNILLESVEMNINTLFFDCHMFDIQTIF